MKKLLIIITIVFFYSCNGQNCNKLPKTFESYEQTKEMVQSSTFEYRKKIDLSSSSWMTWAEYLSCDGEIGFFIFKTNKGKTYIHEKVPMTVWNEFNSAESKGNYYSKNIRGKFRLVPLKKSKEKRTQTDIER